LERLVRKRSGPDEIRARILEVAEEHFRRVGHRKTSVADIASELCMSPANVYRFFPSGDAINEAICRRILNEVTEIAFSSPRTRAPALQKLEELLIAVHHHNKMTLVKEKHMHDLIVAAMHENWSSKRISSRW
jgi:AcrR family transcriptional regulator